MTSSTREQALGAHALLRHALAKTQGELIAERASCSDEPGLMKRMYGSAGRRLSMWADEERIISVLGNTKVLVSTFRVFLRGGIEPVPVWLLGDLVDIVGPGIVGAALRRARKAENDLRVTPYLDAIGVDVAMNHGDEKRALSPATRALQHLPKKEVLLRARVAARASQAAHSRGRKQQSLSLLQQAVQLDPSVIRRLGMSLPAKVRARGGATSAELVADLLEDSPRFHSGRGFVVDVSGSGRALKVCLQTWSGSSLSCTTVGPLGTDPKTKKPKNESLRDYAARLITAFHGRALAMPLGLSTTDLSSLDGSTIVADQAARERLRSLLDEAVEGGK